MTIILHDIPSALPENTWSPNTWKGIPYKTKWVECPDIEKHCKKLGILPTSQRPDGSPYYTLPAIHDTTTDIYLSDSFPIAEYLERTYPSLPSLFPNNTLGLQSIANDAFSGSLMALYTFIYPAVHPKLNAASDVYFCRSLEKLFRKTLEDVIPKGDEGMAQWLMLRKDLEKPASWYAKSGGLFLLGDTVSWADLNIASWFMFMEIVWGEESMEWNDIAAWNNGRWKRLLDALKPYQTVA